VLAATSGIGSMVVIIQVPPLFLREWEREIDGGERGVCAITVARA